MINKKVEAIIFDFGGVLINLDYNATITAFKSLGIPNFDQLYSQANQEGLFDEIETGMISKDDFISRLQSKLPNSISKTEVIKAWNAMLLDVPKQSVELLLKLRDNGYKLYMLSNTNAIHIEEALKRWEETSELMPKDLFDKVYLSHEIQLRKPDKEIFMRVCADSKIRPEEILFIDDSIQHIEGAKSIGMQTLHLKNIKDLPGYFS